MATVTAISESELLDALAAATREDAPEHARTANELAAESGICIKRVRAALAVVKAQGRLNIYTVSREALDGRLSRVAGYTITPAKKGRG
jgi:hypothetical protein